MLFLLSLIELSQFNQKILVLFCFCFLILWWWPGFQRWPLQPTEHRCHHDSLIFLFSHIFLTKIFSGAKNVLASPCSREIYSLENLSTISAAIFQPRMEKSTLHTYRAIWIYFWFFDDAESLWDAIFLWFACKKSPKVRVVRVWNKGSEDSS